MGVDYVSDRKSGDGELGGGKDLLALILDDEQPASQALEKLLSLYCTKVKVVGTVANISACLDVLSLKEIDVLFLDIELGVESGFDLFQKVPMVNFQVIFTTSYSEFAIKAIRAKAVDYLLKPIDPDELVAAVERVASRKNVNRVSMTQNTHLPKIENLTKGSTGLAVVTNSGINLLQLEDIICIEGSGSYSTFYFVNGPKLIASRNLMHYERLIESPGFFRTHQSHLINLTHLRSFTASESQAYLTGDHIIPVSKSKKSALLDRIRAMYRGA